MEGQWLGRIEGSFGADCVINLDRRPDGYSGQTTLFSSGAQPSEMHALTLQYVDNTEKVEGHADFVAVFPEGPYKPIYDKQEIRKQFPTITYDFSRKTIEGHIRDGQLDAVYKTNGTAAGRLKGTLISKPREKTAIPIRNLEWSNFKTEVDQRHRSNRFTGFIYRGQSKPWPLRTSFHRAGRFDIARFAVEDYRWLRNNLLGVAEMPAPLDESEQLAIYLGIAQHHGYPTPLIDWTKSPYVAAYFACRDAVLDRHCKPTVFVFNKRRWTDDGQRILTDIGEPRPGFAFLEPVPARNSRLIPQQSVLVHCNMDAMEGFRSDPSQKNYSSAYLEAFGIADDPIVVLKDLQMMGVTAASMFPGLDGLCRGGFEQSVEVIPGNDLLWKS